MIHKLIPKPRPFGPPPDTDENRLSDEISEKVLNGIVRLVMAGLIGGLIGAGIAYLDNL